MHPAALEEFRPTAADPWDFEKAAHLLRRAGFGGPPEEVERVVELGLPRAVDELLDFDADDPDLARRIESTGPPLFDLAAEEALGDRTLDELRNAWFFRMAHGRHPLQEKLVLLWHDHFACQESDDLGGGLLYAQNRLFRRLSAGTFGDLLRAVARDPAMLVFLDSHRNVKEKPNENWAREVMELFTLGLDRYTQKDVVEIARAFTGWGLRGGSPEAFAFHADRHDTGDKVVLGRRIAGRAGERGVEEGDEILDLLIARDDHPRFLARKILRWFVVDDPDEPLCLATGEILHANHGSVRETLRVLFRSRVFHARESRLALFKNPVELAVSAVRALGIQNAHLLGLPAATRAMGMNLFKPPSVAGWDLGPSWIHAGSALLRSNFASDIASIAHATRDVAGAPAMDVDSIAHVQGMPDTGALEAVASRMLGRPLGGARVRALAARVDSKAGPDRRARIRAAIEVVTGSPEFALS